MSIDLDKQEGRQNYLEEKLDDLLDGINDSYGKTLLDELVTRLEQTIADFNEEIQTLMVQLKANTSKKEKLLKEIKKAEDQAVIQQPTRDEQEPTREVSDWERRLELLEKS